MPKNQIFDMESFSELIGKRRSIRKFTPEKLDPEAVRLLLRAGLISPSSKGTHSYEFVVVEDPQMLQALSQCKAQGADFLAEAPFGFRFASVIQPTSVMQPLLFALC